MPLETAQPSASVTVIWFSGEKMSSLIKVSLLIVMFLSNLAWADDWTLAEVDIDADVYVETDVKELGESHDPKTDPGTELTGESYVIEFAEAESWADPNHAMSNARSTVSASYGKDGSDHQAICILEHFHLAYAKTILWSGWARVFGEAESIKKLTALKTGKVSGKLKVDTLLVGKFSKIPGIVIRVWAGGSKVKWEYHGGSDTWKATGQKVTANANGTNSVTQLSIPDVLGWGNLDPADITFTENMVEGFTFELGSSINSEGWELLLNYLENEEFGTISAKKATFSVPAEVSDTIVSW